MKIYLITTYLNTKTKADNALKALGITPPKSGGLVRRHALLMDFSIRELRAVL